MASRTLSQVISVEKHHRQKDNGAGSAVKKDVQKPQLLYGFTKVYTPKDGDTPDVERIPTQATEVQLRVEEALREVRKYSVPAIDVTATKDTTNCAAKADVKVGSTVIAKDVPISHLLWLEHYLLEIRNFLAVLPVLDPSKKWAWDAGMEMFRSDVEMTTRSLKDEQALVLYDATDKHPAQVKTVIREKPVGTYETTYFSGAITGKRKQELLDRMHALQAAVKDARERANRTEAAEVSEGDKIYDYLFAV